METEIWNDIIEYEGYYQVSNFGRVKSLSRCVEHKKYGSMTIKEKILKPLNRNKDGYMCVILKKNGTSKAMSIHRLVAIYFIPNENNLSEVNHKDGNKKNYRVDNLEWVTPKQNINHAFKTGLNKGVSRPGEKNGNSRLNSSQVNEIIKLKGVYSGIKISKMFNVSKSTIYFIHSKKTWTGK
jgi:hypothetical protein